MIETGRYNKMNKIEASTRFCTFCNNNKRIEDELHFMLQCGQILELSNTPKSAEMNFLV